MAEERAGSMDLERAMTFTTHRDLSIANPYGRPTTGSNSGGTTGVGAGAGGGGGGGGETGRPSSNQSGSTGWSFLSGWWITGSNRESNSQGTGGRNTVSSQAELALRKSNLPSRNTTSSTSGGGDGDQQQWEEGSIMDEETWHWPTLIARVFAFLLLALILVCIALEEITKKFLVLAGIICVLLALIIFATYVDIRKLCGCRKPTTSSPNPNRIGSSTVVTNNPIISTSN